MAISRDVYNIELTAEGQQIVDTIKQYYASQGKKNAADSYSKALRQWFQWGTIRGWTPQTMPPDSVEMYLSERGSSLTTTGIIRNVFRAALNMAPNLGLSIAPQIISTERYRENGKVQLADGSKVDMATQQESQPYVSEQTVYEQSDEQVDAAPLEPVPDLIDEGQVVATPRAVQPPQAPPVVVSSGLAAARSAMQGNGTPVYFAGMPPQQQQKKQAPKPQEPRITNEERAIKNLISNAPFFRVSRVSDGSDPRIPPGMTTFVGIFPAKDLVLNGDIPDFLQRHVVPRTQIRPGMSEILFLVEELDSHRKPTNRREEFPISVPQMPGAMPVNNFSQFDAPVGAAQAQPSVAEDLYLKRLEQQIESSETRERELEKKLQESSNATVTMMLMQQMQRESEQRRELENTRYRQSSPMQDPFGGFGSAPSMPSFAPEPPKQDDGLKELVKILAEKAFAPPPPPPPQSNPMEMFMAMMTMMEKLKPSGPPPEVIQLTTKLDMMTQQMNEKLAVNGTKTLKDQLADLVAMRQAMEMLSGGGQAGPSTGEMIMQNADGILNGIASVVSAMKGEKEGEEAAKPKAAAPRQLPAPAPRQLPPQPRQAPQAQAPVQVPQAPQAAPVQKKAEITPDTAARADQILAREDGQAQETVNDWVGLLQSMLDAPEPFPKMAQRIIQAYGQADVYEDIFAIVKTLFTALGKKAPHVILSRIARVLHAHYTAIHRAMFQSEKTLEDAVVASAEAPAGIEDTAETETETEEYEEEDEEESEEEEAEEEDDDGTAAAVG